MRVAVYTRLDGGISYVSPWPRLAADGEKYDLHPPWRLSGESEADCERRTADRLVPVVVVLTEAQRAAYASLLPVEASPPPAGVPVEMLPAEAAAVGASGTPLPYTLVEIASLPSRRFRNAWQHNAGVVSVHMGKARDLRKAELIRQREQLFAVLRGQLEAAEDAADVAQQTKLRKIRKGLRGLDTDLDVRLAALTTPEALAAFVPQELLEIP